MLWKTPYSLLIRGVSMEMEQEGRQNENFLKIERKKGWGQTYVLQIEKDFTTSKWNFHLLLTSVHHHSFTSLFLFFGIFLYRDHLAVTDLKKVYEAMREIGRSDSEWHINLVKKFTHQTDSTSCGAFVCLFFECLAVGVSLENKDSFDLDLQSYRE